jgi:hypothetical protein
MSEPFYTASARIERIGGVERQATLATGDQINFGVHGPIKRHYNIDARDLPLPVDFIVASTGA